MDRLSQVKLYEEAQELRKRNLFSMYKKFFSSKASRGLFQQLFSFILSFIASRATVFGGYSPFGVAVVASVPYNNMLSSSIGALLACLFPSVLNNEIRYIASVLAVLALRWALNDFKMLKEHTMYAPLVAAAPLFSTGVAVSLLYINQDKTQLIISIIETILAAVTAFFFSSVILIFSENRETKSLNPQQVACVCICLCIILLGLSDVSIASVSIGRILSILVILFCSRYGSVAAGAIAGTCIGVILSLSSYELSYLAGSYAFAGLISGVFSKLGNFATVIAFVLSNAIVVLQAGDSSAALSSLIEVAISTIIFILIPREFGESLTSIFDESVSTSDISGLKETVIMRLNFASSTLCDVSNCVEKIAQKLKKLCITDIDEVHKVSADNICKDCPQKLECWDTNYEKTKDAMNNISIKLKEKTKIDKNDFPLHFACKCEDLNNLTNEINSNYQSYLSSRAAQNRIDDIRSVVKEQIAFMSDILTDFTKELNTYEKFDCELSNEICRVLKEYGFDIHEVSCRTDKNEIMAIEIKLAKKGYKRILKHSVLHNIEKICKKKLDVPCVSTSENECRVQISEKPGIYIKNGAYQHICNDARMCGDSFKYFSDGMGKQIYIISDGMGTGGRAAVDSAMACGIFEKLVKAGIGLDCALRLVNSSLMVKSGEESIATLDVVCVNLFSGLVEFKKAGAAFTYVRHRNDIIKIDIPSLPAGILTKIKFGSEELTLADNDRIIMVSDGVTAGGDKWLMKEIAQWEDESERDFAERMVEQAQFRRSDGHDDDITVVAMKLISR